MESSWRASFLGNPRLYRMRSLRRMTACSASLQRGRRLEWCMWIAQHPFWGHSRPGMWHLSQFIGVTWKSAPTAKSRSQFHSYEQTQDIFIGFHYRWLRYHLTIDLVLALQLPFCLFWFLLVFDCSVEVGWKLS